MSISKLFCERGQISEISKIELYQNEPFSEKHKLSNPKFRRTCGKIELYSDEFYGCKCLSDNSSQRAVREVPNGLWNFANNCYLNSVLQIFLNIPNLTNFIFDNKESFYGGNDTFFLAFHNLLESYKYNQRDKLKQHQKEIKKILERENPGYRGAAMQDPADTLQILLNLLEEEMGEYLKVNSTQGTNVAKEYFVSTIDTNSLCLNCTYENKFQTEVYMIRCALSKKEKNVDINSCIDSFIHEKRNCIMCDSDNCNSLSSFVILPKFLFIHLERVYFNEKFEAVKNRIEVDYNTNLKLKLGNGFEHYQLQAVIIHIGDEATKGHFVTAIRYVMLMKYSLKTEMYCQIEICSI